MKKRLPIGIDDYKKVIENNYYHVDKTLFIQELWKQDLGFLKKNNVH